MIAGCTEEGKPPPRPASPKVSKSKSSVGAGKIEVPSIFKTQKEEYSYNPIGKRDPFKKYIGEDIKEVERPRSPLERYDLDELKLTAIVWGIASPRALIHAPDGYSYIVRQNARLGKNRGRVSRITRRKVFVEEEYRDPTGKLVVRESSFEIRKKEKKKKSVLKLRFSDEEG